MMFYLKAPGIIGGDTSKFLAGSIGAAVNDDLDRLSLPADRGDSAEQPGAGIVAGNEHQMGERPRVSPDRRQAVRIRGIRRAIGRNEIHAGPERAARRKKLLR